MNRPYLTSIQLSQAQQRREAYQSVHARNKVFLIFAKLRLEAENFYDLTSLPADEIVQFVAFGKIMTASQQAIFLNDEELVDNALKPIR